MINSIQSTKQNNYNPAFSALTPGGKNVLIKAAEGNSDLVQKAEELISRAENNKFVLLDILENDIMHNNNYPSASILHNNQEVEYICHHESNIFTFAEHAIKCAEEFVLKTFKKS